MEDCINLKKRPHSSFVDYLVQEPKQRGHEQMWEWLISLVSDRKKNSFMPNYFCWENINSQDELIQLIDTQPFGGKMNLAPRAQKPDEFCFKVTHQESVTGVALCGDRGFSASKDGAILHWDVDIWVPEKYHWPSDEVFKSKQVLSLAVSSDGRYLATGGLDGYIHLWDVRSRQHIRAYEGHKGPVSCLAFGQGTSEIISGSSVGGSIKFWDAGSEIKELCVEGGVSNIESLSEGHVLTAGLQNTVYLWKVPENSKSEFSAPEDFTLECCCSINNSEFLSGFLDGSVGLWNTLHSTPVHIEKKVAHPQLDENVARGDLSTVTSVAVCRATNLFASGAGNGSVCLWEMENDLSGTHLLFDMRLNGYVNSLAFTGDGRFLIAGVGQEHRFRDLERVADAKNGVAVLPCNYEGSVNFWSRGKGSEILVERMKKYRRNR